MSDNGLEFDAVFGADDASLAALATKITAALTRGLDGVAQDLGKTVAQAISEVTKKVASDVNASKLKAVGAQMEAGFKGASAAAGDASRAQKQLLQDSENLAKTLGALRKVKYVDPDLFELAAQNIRKLQTLSADIIKTDFSDSSAVSRINKQFEELRRTSIDSLKIINRVSDQAATEARQSFQRQTDAANAAAREKNTILRTSGEKEILLQRQANKVVEAEAQKSKGLAIANRQALWAALLRIESAGIAGLQGVAKTGVGAVGRVWDATFGNITRTVAQKYSIINRTTSESFNKTEAITRASLRKQETLFATSLSRQERLVSSFQKRTSTGLAGAVSGRGIGGGLASIGGGFAVGKLVADGFNEAKDSIEAANKAQVVFGDSFAGIEKLGLNSAKAMGLTKSEALGAAASFGALLKPLGYADDASAFLSAGLTQLGADMASFNNVPLEDALLAIRAGLVGESEPLRRLGVTFNDAELKAKALTMGLYSGKGALDAYAKSQALIAILYEKTSFQQGDFARTSGEVANQLKITSANLKNTFGALLVNTLPVVKVGLNGFNVVLENLTKFINGEVSGALKVLRDGLVGAAAGLGALLAAKAAVEVVQLLGVALKAALTPMGLLVLAAAAVGAAFVILSKRSEGFRKVVASARETVIGFGEGIREKLESAVGFVGDAIGSLVDQIQRVVDIGKAFGGDGGVLGTFRAAFLVLSKELVERLPFLEPVVDFFKTSIPKAFEFAKKAVEGVKDLFAKIGDIASIGEAYGGPGGPLGLLRATWLVLSKELVERLPFMEPVIEFFEREIPRAIEFTKGAFKSLVAGAKAVAGQVRDALSNFSIGPALGVAGAGIAALLVGGPVVAAVAAGAALIGFAFKDEISEKLSQARDVIVGFFEGIDWAGLALGVLDFVETAGRLLGQIVTDKRLLIAFDALALAAGAIAVKFVKGFVGGVIDGLSDPATVALITANLAVIFGGAKLLGLFKSQGSAIATALQTGFKSVASLDFMGALLGGGGTADKRGATSAFDEARKQQKAFADEVRRTNLVLAEGGRTQVVPPFGKFTEVEAKAARKALGELKADIGESAVAGLRMRSTFRALSSDVAPAFRNLSNAIGTIDLKGAATAGKQIGKTITRNIGDSLANARASLGITAGQQIGAGVLAGLGSALAGQQLGKGDVVGGLGGIIASSLAAAAVGGPLVGAAVAGLGAVSAAFSLQAENVKRTKERVDAYKDSILAATDPTDVFANVFKGLGDESKDILADAGFTIDQLTAAVNGNGAALQGTIKNVEKFQSENINADDFGNSELALRFLNGALKDYSSATGKAAVEAKVLGSDLEGAGRSSGALGNLLGNVKDKINEVAEVGRVAVADKFINDAKTAADDAIIAFQNANAELIKFLNPDAGTVEETLNRVIQSLPGLASQVQGGIDLGGALGEADIEVALAGLDTSIADIVAKGLEDGLSTDQIKEKIAGLSVAIGELEVPQEVKDALIGEIAGAVLNDKIDVIVTAKTEADTASAEAAAADIAAKVAEIVAEYGPNLNAPGKSLADGVAVGIDSGAIKVTNAASRIAAAAKKAFKDAIESASPSKVFIREGQNIGSGVVIGMESFMPKVGDASRTMGESVGRQAAEGIRIAKIEATEALSEFIDSLNEQINGAQFDAIQVALSGGQTLDEARTGVGADLKGIIEAGASIRDSIKEGKGGSFGFSGADGIENRQEIFGIVGNIKDLAETLFESGASVQDITAEILFMREALLNTAGAAGFNRGELEALIDSLGLSQGAINSLATATAEAQKQVTDAAAAEKAKADADAQIRADQEAADARDAAAEEAARGQTIINNNIVVPYGDMQAIALAVSNRQQSEAARRVRR